MRKRERREGEGEATMTGGCGRLLSTEAVFLSSLSHLSLSSLSHAPVMPPLLSSSLSLSSLSVLALQGFDRVFGCVVWAVWRVRTRLRGELDTARPETLGWLREVAVVLYGLPAPPGIPGGHRSIRERIDESE